MVVGVGKVWAAVLAAALASIEIRDEIREMAILGVA